MLPQPPPDIEPPPPSEQAIRSRRWMGWIIVVGVVSVVGLGHFGYLWVASEIKKANLNTAISSAKLMGLALSEFDAEYGKFPGSDTVADVNRKNPGHGIPLSGTSSNACFRQLFAADLAKSEMMFYTKTSIGHKPDNIFGTHTLEKGECAFAYVAGLSTKDDSATPVVLFPLLPGKRQFDYETAKRCHDGKAVILKIDSSVTTIPVNKSGEGIYNGKNILDPSHPVWHGKLPDIRWPE